jgi:4-hydroxy-2-oxoheptanedioate aldolase
VPRGEYTYLARALDMGASGVQVPMVETPEQAERLAKRLRYPVPGGGGGTRGSAFSGRAAGYGAFGGPAHTRRSNEALVLVVMIETPLGVSNASAIASVPGVDVVFVGPNDLAHTMGHENRWSDAPVQAAMPTRPSMPVQPGTTPRVGPARHGRASAP